MHKNTLCRNICANIKSGDESNNHVAHALCDKMKYQQTTHPRIIVPLNVLSMPSYLYVNFFAIKLEIFCQTYKNNEIEIPFVF